MYKEKEIKYTDRCIYIDKHIYEESHDVDKIFTYLQDLFYILAVKKRFFNTMQDYKDYALYCASKMYLRLTNKNQFLPEDDPKHIPKIKSSLNFIKKLLYPLKVEYQKENFNSICSPEIQGEWVIENIKHDLEGKARTSLNELLQVEIEHYFSTISKTIKAFLKQTPYAKDKVSTYKLYISCLISLLRAFTLSNENQKKLDKFNIEGKVNRDELLSEMYLDELNTCAVNWHLEKGMEDYIFVLINQIKKLVCKDINYMIQSYDVPEDIIKDILMNPNSKEINNNDD